MSEEKKQITSRFHRYIHRFQYLSILIHELLHWIVALFVIFRIGYIRISSVSEYDMYGSVNWHLSSMSKRSFFSQIMISIAPIFAIPIVFLLSFYLSPWFYILLVYEIINIQFAIPSIGDIKLVLFYDLYKSECVEHGFFEYNIFDVLEDKISYCEIICYRKKYIKILLEQKEKYRDFYN